MADIIYVSNVRLSFPHLIEPQKFPDPESGKEKISYNCELLLLETHPAWAQFTQACNEVCVEKWKEHAAAVMNIIKAERKQRCFGRGEEKINKKTFQVYDGYTGNMYITCGRDRPPQIIQSNGSPVDPNNTMAYQQLTRAMYAGCRVNAAIKPWAQTNKKGGNGIRCDLVAIQFAGDDAPFGEGSVDASNLFGGVSTAPATPAATGLPSFMMG